MSTQAIGVFDSGIGGLTVVKEIIKICPHENIIYLGDTARIPYGTRGSEVITKYALELVDFLLSKKVKFLVIACNTISAVCLDEIIKRSTVPVMGVIKPTVEESMKVSNTNIIGIIGTQATISSKVYEKEIHALMPKISVITQSCPLLVPLAEEGLASHLATKAIIQDYLSCFRHTKIDTLILGCTHYPVFKKSIKKYFHNKITLIDSARPTAEKLKTILSQTGLENNHNRRGKLEIYVTDAPSRVKKTVSQFLDYPIKNILEKIDLF